MRSSKQPASRTEKCRSVQDTGSGVELAAEQIPSYVRPSARAGSGFRFPPLQGKRNDFLGVHLIKVKKSGTADA